MILFQVVSALIAVYFSAIVFEAPKPLLIWIACIGGSSWLVYLLFIDSIGPFAATYISGLVVATFSHLAARFFKAPVTVFFIPGFFPLVPGAGMYRTVYWFITGNVVKGNAYLQETLTIAGMIALAIFTIDSFFRIYSEIQKQIQTKKR